MSVEWTIHPYTEFSSIREDWDTLNGVTSQTPLQDSEFWMLLLRFFGSGNERICICRCNGEVVAATIIEQIGKGRWQTSAPAQAPLGAWLVTETLPISDLLATLTARLPGYTSSIGVVRQDPELAIRPFETRNLSTLDYIRTGRVCCDDGFDEYWKRRGKNLRQNLNRQRNRLSREDVRTQLRAISDLDSIGDSVNAYGILESAGWKAESGTSLHPSNTQGKFYRALFDFYSRKAESIAYEYYYNDDLVAMDLCLRRGNALVILKTTHDEEQTGTSPALLMRQDSFRMMFDNEGITQIEFFGKQMDWHTKWTDDFRQMYHVNYDRWLFLSWLRRIAR